jgi:hypothetical protein
MITAKITFRMKDRTEYTFDVKGSDQDALFEAGILQLRRKLDDIAGIAECKDFPAGWNDIESWQTTTTNGTPGQDKHDGLGVAAARSTLQKVRFELLPLDALTMVAKVLTFGAYHYGDRNWESGFSWSRCIGSTWRHFIKWVMGEEYDDESNLHHLAHAIANLLFLLAYSLRGVGSDDRPRVVSPEAVVTLFKAYDPTINTKKEGDTDATD